MPWVQQSTIDRRSPVPFYFQLKRIFLAEIEAGRWSIGDRLPSEPAICEQFSVSRTTVRQALAELESEGFVRRERGRGTFVSDRRPSSWLLQSSHGFYDEAVRTGHVVTSRVIRCELAPLPDWASTALGLDAASLGVAIERLRWVDGQLVMYVVNHLPPELAETVLGADLENGSLYKVLEEVDGLVVVGGRRLVEAVTAQDDLANLLEIESGGPLLFVESVSWDGRLRAFECYRAWHRADRTKIDVQVVHPDVASKAGFDPTTLRIGEH